MVSQCKQSIAKPLSSRCRSQQVHSPALAGGLFWFKGHNHLVAIRDFSGEADAHARFNHVCIITHRRSGSASLTETSDVFTEPQKQIINKELREIVLHPEKFPEIVFQSTEVKGKTTGSGTYQLKIGGNLTLHGVTRLIEIPTQLTVAGNELRARGEFDVNRSDFNVKATSAFHGLVRVKDRVHFTFDIVGEAY